MLKVYNLQGNNYCLHKIKNSKITNSLFLNQQSNILEENRRTKGKKPSTMLRKWKPELLKIEKVNCANYIKNYTLLSYNILAQDLLLEHIHLYYDIDNKILKWQSRLNKLKEEIAILHPDILCLQEMQYNHLNDLVNQLSSTKQNRRLEYVFKKKTGTRSDGCVIIYDKNKFKLISEQCVEYYTDGIPTLNRENIGIMVMFQSVDENSETFVVATTHLLYNPRREDVRISQVNKLMQAIIEFSSPTNSFENKSRLPVILTGDFNFTPDTRGYEILTAKLRAEKCQDGDYDKEFFQMDAVDFGMVSGASTYQGQWIIVDYILKSRSQTNMKSININGTYILPSVEQCWKSGKIPNNFVGSDHFSLAIQFSII